MDCEAVKWGCPYLTSHGKKPPLESILNPTSQVNCVRLLRPKNRGRFSTIFRNITTMPSRMPATASTPLVLA